MWKYIVKKGDFRRKWLPHYHIFGNLSIGLRKILDIWRGDYCEEPPQKK